MGLPIQTAPTYVCNLSDGREVKYRPFLVREQKYLLIAKESESSVDIANALIQLIDSTTFGTVDASKLSLFDIEYLFLQIRTKSVGETTKARYFCEVTDCEGSGEVTIDLSKVQLTKNDSDNKIMLTDTLGVILDYPSISELSKVEEIEDTQDRLIATIMYGLNTIFDENEVYESKDIKDSDLKEFVESLTLEQLDKIETFYTKTPSLEERVEFACDVCGTQQERILRGLNSFF